MSLTAHAHAGLSITTKSPLSPIAAGSPASIAFEAQGGNGSLTWSPVPGTVLPEGMSLSPSGVLIGTPAKSNYVSFRLKVSDSSTPVQSGLKTFVLQITPDAPTISSPKFDPPAQVDKSYSYTFNAIGGKPPYTFSTNSTLPAGLTLSSSGLLSGTPLLAAAPNSTIEYKIAVKVTGSNAVPQFSIRTYKFPVIPAAAPVITTKTLPNAEMGQEYFFDGLQVTGGKPPYTFSAGAAFPGNLVIAQDGTISGTPNTAGDFKLRINVKDANNRTGTGYVALKVIDAPTPKITTASPLYWTLNQTIETTLAASEGQAPYTWAKIGTSSDPLRNLPAGVSLNTNGTFAGKPTAAGTFKAAIRVTDSLGKGSTKTFTIVVSAGSLEITSPSVLPAAYAGVSVNLILTVSGGFAPYKWSLKNRGTLPATVLLGNSTGSLTGTINAAGNYTFTALVADTRSGTPATAEKQLTLPVLAYDLAISTSSLPDGTAGANYTSPLTATGGKTPYAWSFTPPVAGLSATSGNLAGKPTAAGNYTIALKVTDANAKFATRNLTLRINDAPPLAFNPLSLPNGRVGISYNATLGATGGFTPYTFALKQGTLPPGLSFASTTGAITGKPTTAGTYKFTIVLKDSKGTIKEQELTIIIDPYGMSMSGPATISGAQFSAITPAQFTVTGGTANYTWSVTPALPTALLLNSRTGLVSGNLTAAIGNYTVVLKVTDGNLQSATRNLTVGITTPLSVSWVTPAILPEAKAGVAYSQELSVTGGRSPYTYALKTGSSLPSGLTLAMGKISGMPRTSGTFKFTIIASDSQSPKATAEREFTLLIKPAEPLAITPPNPMPAAYVGSVFGPASFKGSGGLPPYTWSVTPSPVAPGLTFSMGNLTGTPTVAGNYTFTVRVVDGTSKNATQTVTLQVLPAGLLEWVTTELLPVGSVLKSYSATLATRGGVAPITITRISGNLSTGVTLTGNRISGIPTAEGNATFTLQAKDKNGATANRTFTLPIAPYDLAISEDSPSEISGVVREAISPAAFNAEGGKEPYTWSATGLPTGISISSTTGIVSGTANATGNSMMVVTVKDGNQRTAHKTCPIRIVAGNPPIFDATQQLPAGMVGVPYPNPEIIAEGGIAPYKFSVKTGSSLPAGLRLNATTGIISGTPTTAGNTTTTIAVTGANGVSAERSYPIRIDANDLAIPSEDPWVISAQVYKDFGPLPLEATGGLTPYKWSMTPATTANLTLDAAGTLKGRPATEGNFSVSFKVVDARNATVSKNAIIRVAPADLLEFVTEPNLPDGKVAAAYGSEATIQPVPSPSSGVSLAGQGGLAPYTYTPKTVGTLPPGLALSTAGKITGTPTTAGTFKFFVVIKDAKNTSAEREFTIVVETYGMSIDGTDSIIGVQYSAITPAAFTPIGGMGNYTWSVNTTAGLTINATTGVVSGVLTAAAGNYTMRVSVRDGLSQIATQNVTVGISPAPPLTMSTESPLPTGSVNGNYTQAFVATGGRPSALGGYIWAIASPGNLPVGTNGFSINATTGLFKGISATALTANFTIRVTDSNATTVTKPFTLTIGPGPSPSPSPSPNPPTISSIANQITNEDTPTGALAFTVGDLETPLSSLTITASSSNTTLIPNSNVVLGGSGANRTVTVTPAANQSGNATITVSVGDGTATANTTFTVSIVAVNDLPTISSIANQTTNEDTATGAVAFTVADQETPFSSLTITASSGNTTLIPNGNIVLGGSGANRTVTVTPAANQSGNATITVSVGDGTATANTTFTVSVTEVNDLPTISSIANQTTNEDTATGALAFTVGDLETLLSSLTITASSSNTTLIPNSNVVLGGSGANRTVTVTPAANQSGNATITVSVGDGTATSNTTFTVSVLAVNDLPTISSIANQTTNEDTATGALAFTVGDAETPLSSLTITASSGNTTLIPSGNIVLGGSGANRTVTVTPSANQSGNATITVSVGDGTATSNTTFTVSVTEVNDLPTISSIANQTTNEDTATGAVAFTVGDVETPLSSLTITASSGNTTLIPNGNIFLGGSGANRTVTVTPAANQSGNATITVSVGDGTATANTTFTVSVVAVNDLPTISSIANQTTNEDTPTGALAFTVGDQETPLGSLTITASSGNTTLIPNSNVVLGGSGANRTVTVTPATNQSGNATITVSVGDGTVTANTTFMVSVVAVNDLPTISSIGNQTTNEDTATGALAFTVGDLETPLSSLTITASSGNTTLIPNSNVVLGGSGANRTVAVTPAANQSGNATITVSVGDGTATSNATFMLSVTEVNDLPTISSIANQTTNEDTPTGAVAFTVGDQETPLGSLTISASSGNTTLIPNSNVVLGGNGANRTVTVTPAANQSGNATITVSVGDGSATSNTTFTVSVAEVNDLPLISSIANQTTNEDTATGAVAFTVDDLETPAASLIISTSSSNTTLIPNSNVVLGGSGANRTVTVTPAANQSGNATITVSVGDGSATSNTTFTVSVTEVNDLPTISSISNQTTNEDTATGVVAFTVGDQETPLGSLTITASSGNTTLIPSGNIVLGGSGANRTVTVTPAANQSGNATITVSVGDGTVTANTTFMVSVVAVNDLPTISSIANQTTNEDTPTGAVAFTVGDLETPLSSLTITASSGNTTLIPNSNVVLGGSGANRTVTVTPAANQSGNATITVSVGDGSATSNTTFTVSVAEVNDLPSISSIANQTTNEDTATGAVAFTVDDLETPAASLIISTSSSNTTLIPNSNVVLGGSGANRTVTVTPAANQSGNATITVSVGDGTVTANTTFTVSVVAVNDLPTISSIANQTTNEDTATGAVAFTVADQETPLSSLTITASSGNTTLIPSSNVVLGGSGANRTVTVTPAANQSGNATITVSVGDGTATANTTFTVSVTEVNDLPTISSIANQTTNEDTATGAVAFTVDDLETPAASLIISTSSSNTTLIPNSNVVLGGSGANRTVTVTPAANQSGNATITVSVGDGTATANTSFTVRVVAVNDLPTISLIANQTTNEDTPTGALAFTVADQETPLGSLTITASSGNTTLIPSSNIVLGGSGANRTVTVTPAANQSGNATITVIVGDGAATSNTTFTVSVVAVNDLPTISSIANQTTNEDTATGVVAFTVGDQETPLSSLTITASSGNTMLVPSGNIVLGGSGANRTVTVTPVANQSGNATITLSVGDGTATANTTFTVSVVAVNDPPTISDISNASAYAGSALDPIGFVVGDLETPISSLTVLASSGNTTLIPNSNIVLGGSGANRTVTITPALSQGGNATITVSVGDGALVATKSFTITVKPSTKDMVAVLGGTLPQASFLANQTVSSFQIGRYEVTWSLWQEVRTWAVANGYTDLANVGNGSSKNHPVTYLTWYDAVKWCNARSQMEGLAPVYLLNGSVYKTGQSIPTLIATANGYRLPYEAEWEWAARGGALSKGYIYSGSNDPNLVAWYFGNVEGQFGTKQVGLKEFNELGINDMGGNVWEFIWNSASPADSYRIPRGGMWNTGAQALEINTRVINSPSYNESQNWGFRVARNVIGDMVVVQGGTLPPGSTLANQTVSAFQIGRTEVTWGEWKTVRAWATSRGYDIGATGGGVSDNHPVTEIQWYDAVKWCNAKSEMEGLAPVYSYNGSILRIGGWQVLGSDATDNIVSSYENNGYRLPNTSEWEWAARGGIYSKGYTYSGSNDPNAVAWYSVNSGNTTRTVATKTANELGIFEMSGNAMEWCWNRIGTGRSARGGTWNNLASEYLANNQIGNWLPSVANFHNNQGDFGFRIARKIGPAISITDTLPVGTLNQPYAGYTFRAVGSAGEKIWSISEGALPLGMSFNATTATLGGTPTQAGEFNFVLRVESGGYWDEVEIVLHVVASGVTDSDNDGVNDYRETYDGTNTNDSQSFDPLSIGLLAHYPFEGNTYDVSGYQKNLDQLHRAYLIDNISSDTSESLRTSLQLVADNDFAVFAGTKYGITRLIHQNNAEWPTQIVNAATVTFDLQVGEDTYYILAMDGGGDQDISGKINGKNMVDLVGGDSSYMKVSPNIAPFITGWNNDSISWGSFPVSLQTAQEALKRINESDWVTPVAVFDNTVLKQNPYAQSELYGKRAGFTFTPSGAVFFRVSVSKVGNKPVTGQALRLESPDAYAESTKFAGISGNSPRTIAFDFFSDGPQVHGYAFKLGSFGNRTNGNASFISIDPANNGIIFVDNDYRNISSEKITSLHQKVHHVVWTYNGSLTSSKVYLDGKLVQATIDPENAGVYTLNTPDGPITLGRRDGIGFKGNIDNLRIYNRALSAAEVSQLYSEESGEPNMVLVQGGTLPAGSALANQTVSAFHIARFETTWAEWKQVRTWAAANGYDIGTAGNGTADSHPVRNVSWYDAVKWCNAKSQMEGLVPVYSINGTTYKSGDAAPTLFATANGYRLPAEAEWEWAARGGVQSKGYTYSGSNDANAAVWYANNSGGSTNEVGTKLANELLIHDMNGNVYEWVFDASPPYRRIRGGSWANGVNDCSIVNRGTTSYPFDRYPSIGFRYARNAIGDLVTVQGGTLPASSGLANQKVQAFQIGRTEVTWDEWQTVRTWAVANGYTDLAGVGNGTAGNHPVRNVSWYDVVKWSNAKSQMEGLSPVYTVNGTTYRTGNFGANGSSAVQENQVANGYRLPAEGEWEWAALGGIKGQGYKYSGSNDLNSVGWFFDNAINPVVDLYNGRGTFPVALKAANELGIYDMSGNVWEWCFDPIIANPSRTDRAIRGGSLAWDATRSVVLNRSENYAATDYLNNTYGFRLARNIGAKISTAGAPVTVNLNEPYAGYAFGAVGSTGDKVWSISEGTLPPGMSFSANGTLSGTPTTAGIHKFTIRLESGGYWDEVDVELAVVASGLKDSDGDGVNDYRETYDGTNPNDPQSFDPLSIGLVAHYPFDGNANDETKNGYDATGANLAFAQDRNGNNNASLALTTPFATSKKIYLASTANRTFSEWVKAVEFPAKTSGAWGPKPNADFAVYPQSVIIGNHFSGDGQWWMDTGNGVAFYNIATSSQWKHLTVVYQGDVSTAKVFLNGVPLPLNRMVFGKVAFDSGEYAPIKFDPVAWNTSGLSSLNLIDNVRVYNRALSDAEVAQLYAKETGGANMVTVQGGTLPASSGLAGQSVASFRIGKYEVTWGEWESVRTWAVANGYDDLAGVGNGTAGNHPVQQVSWYEVVKWCNARSEKEGLSPVYQIGSSVYRTGANVPTINGSANGYRLPLEKEWEWAARGGVSSKGYTFSGSNDANAVAWHPGNSGSGTKAVGIKLANELGIYDMSGNVWEWCWDLAGANRRIRGGGWQSSVDGWTLVERGFAEIYGRSANLGFRLARNIGPKISITGTLPEATLNQAYAGYTFGAVGSMGNNTWTISEGSLPPGMSFSANGTISGTPTSTGTYTFVIRLESGGYSDEVEIVLGILPNFVFWGSNSLQGRLSVPSSLRAVKSIDAGFNHSLALKLDGTVMAWGGSGGADNITTIPSGLSNVIEIDCGWAWNLVRKSDGSLVAWGANDSRQLSSLPSGTDFTQISAGNMHGVALKSDGTVVCWGRNDYGQSNVPTGLSGVVKVIAYGHKTIALLSNGTVRNWGAISAPPVGLSNVKDIAAGDGFHLALKTDGSVVAWGDNTHGQTSIPAGLNNVVSIFASADAAFAVKNDATIVSWGNNQSGQRNVPSLLTGKNIIEIRGNAYHVFARTAFPISY